MMTDEIAVVGLVRARAQLVRPDDRHAADLGVDVALHSFAGGASVSEACREGRRFLECWSRHPANRPVDAKTEMPLAC